MTIISISLNDTILQEVDRLHHKYGYSGRSEVIRAGIRLLSSEHKNTESLSGNINAILIVIHSHETEHIVSSIKHQFEEVTITQLHSHLKDNTCLELFILEGDSQQIKNMVQQFETNKKMNLVKLIKA